MHKRNRKITPPSERFWKYVLRAGPNDCWLWLGGTNGRYGRFALDGRRDSPREEYAHRFSYEMAYGPIPPRYDIHHTCENPLCVNPRHLVAKSRRQHARLSKKGRQKLCVHGHVLDGVKANGSRYCKTCNRKRALLAKERKHLLAASDPARVPHGTANGYFNYGCRCDECKVAGSAYLKSMRAKAETKQEVDAF